MSRHKAVAQKAMRDARLIFKAALRELKHGCLDFAPMHWQDYYRARREHAHALMLSRCPPIFTRKLNHVYQ